MTLIRDLIEIPDEIYQGDFVLNLSNGIHQESTLKDYVVTTQLVSQFENALGFVQSAVASNQTGTPAGHFFFSGKNGVTKRLFTRQKPCK